MTTIRVSNISAETSESELTNFFSFCGKIVSSSYDRTSHTASITFERPSATRTAVLLNGTPLNNSPLHVTSEAPSEDHPEPSTPTGTDVRQEDKPKSAVLAEYLASGYAIGDQALQKAIELDNKHQLSSTFSAYLTNALQTLDARTGASNRAKQADQTLHLSDTAHGLAQYFEKALETPTGQRVRAFYERGAQQVMDIHNEAKRLAGLRKDFGASADGKPFDGSDKTTCACGGKAPGCECPQGRCSCAGCPRAVPKKEAEGEAGAAGQLGHAFQDVKGTVQDVRAEGV